MGKRDKNRKSGVKKSWNTEQNISVSKNRFNPVSLHETQNREAAIKEFKARENICSKCKKPIEDMSTAISDKNGNPMHFDCVLETLKAEEKMTQNQEMAYIGNGRFAVVSFENPQDTQHFKIEKIIEWENKETTLPWRKEMADLYSQVK